MAAFLVISVAGDDLTDTVRAAFEPAESFEVNSSAWLVSRPAVRSSWEVWEALTQTAPDTMPSVRPRIIIVPMKGYYGRASASVWQWLEVKDAQDA